MTSDRIPAVLVDPPWLLRLREYEAAKKAERAAKRAAAGKPPQMAGLTPPGDRVVSWTPELRRRYHIDKPSSGDAPYLVRSHGWEHLVDLYEKSELSTSLQWSMFLHAPEELVRPLLPGWRPAPTGWHMQSDISGILSRFECEALDAVLAEVRSRPQDNGDSLLPFRDVQIARLMADWLHRLKSAREIAEKWFDLHGAAAVPFLVPDALGTGKALRDRAVTALTALAGKLGAERVVEAARHHGDEAAEAVALLLSVASPAAVPAGLPERPAQPPKLPWLDRNVLPELRLRDGSVLPLEIVENVIGGLSLSYGALWDTPAQLPGGIAEALEALEPRSLAAFGWALFDAWLGARTPSRSGWVIDQFIWTADDTTVARLGDVLGRWPGAGGTDKHAIGVLGWIATDAALRELHRTALRGRPPGRVAAAEERLRHAATSRGLSAGELADRIVDDLGLEGDGSLLLDYGPRRFTVEFDASLVPYVTDDGGGRRTMAPRPAAKDDPVLATAAYERFTELRKGARALGRDQVNRLEHHMVNGHRWNGADFRRFVLGHPLLWRIASGLVWCAGGIPFRIAEDRTLADVDDTAFTAGDDATVTIAHPAALGPDAVAAWTAIFGDYLITQPFPQLGRPVDTLTEEERRTGELARFTGRTVPVGALLGLTRKGWRRGPVEDGGVEYTLHRYLPGSDLVIRLSPGIVAGRVHTFPEQRLESVAFESPPGTPGDPVPISELLVDLAALM
ncbi:DUF4132 domain-containing protein [Actinomadura sp. 9N407]|uniref:DUF4132 domain-containing protein n=1 Tax=Actinomadura sp. 9N407 TaxID=3375154 RepID=UPI003788CEBB